MYVIDASVLVADARPSEPNHTEAHHLLSLIIARRLPVFAPVIALAEVAAALSRGTGDASIARGFITQLQQISLFHFIPVDNTLGQQAAALAAEHQIRGCDAIYVALAEARSTTLITLDHQQRERVPLQVKAYTPAEELTNLLQDN
jgi:predicted nucleic acid-binding protein